MLRVNLFATDVNALEEIRSKRAQMDNGIHIGSWGQLQGT